MTLERLELFLPHLLRLLPLDQTRVGARALPLLPWDPMGAYTLRMSQDPMGGLAYMRPYKHLLSSVHVKQDGKSKRSAKRESYNILPVQKWCQKSGNVRISSLASWLPWKKVHPWVVQLAKELILFSAGSSPLLYSGSMLW